MRTIDDRVEADRLALLTMQLIELKGLNEQELEKAFLEALPRALRLIHVADQFLRERKAEQGNWWNTEESKAEMARVKEEFDVTNPPIYERRPGNLNDS